MSPTSFALRAPAFALVLATLAPACATTSNSGWDVPPADASTTDDVRDAGRSDVTDTHTDTRVDAPADVARDTGHDTGVDVVHDTGRDTGTRICPPSCTTDNDCVSTCPSAPSGQVWCCEFNTCTSLAMCPAGTDGGTGSDAFGFDVPSLDGFFGDGGCFGTPCTTDADCVAACGAGATCFGGFCF